MTPLEQLLQIQKQHRTGHDGGAEEQRQAVFLHVRLRGSEILVPIEETREVIELHSLVPYPVPRAGHLGIVSVHGEVIPVLAVTNEANEAASARRMLVLSDENGQKFAIVADSVRKVTLDEALVLHSDVIPLHDRPVQVFQPKAFASRKAA